MTNDAKGATRSRRKTGAPKNWRDIFIAKLGETSNVSAAAQAANISVSQVYKIRRNDPTFARRWFGALTEGYDNLEMELLHRLRSGQTEYVDEDGNKRKFDLGTAFRCLLAHRETVAREKGRRTLAQEAATIASVNAKIDAMRAREAEAKRLMAGLRRNKTDTESDG
ncbi:hypothetical protein FHS61_000812 [Altererythrobacter atlanticus]|uniref:Uncharacterized protein n=1 Tax=Croceibacterium atlanticum TaxID=1267766 RepID=A0A0F7KV21_9SPHN|nr:hypothetical protein [Croceibacterium atlanticum]AKH43484.1 hypothetical protein WYH_02454 [Croceibacterium atlanticum]MBB5731808.1 hypothetical protein [Croceibacterium atlanticum]